MKLLILVLGMLLILPIPNKRTRLRCLAVFSVAFMLLLLFGCSTERPKPEVVNVPVTVPCVKDRPVKPQYYFEQLPPAKTEVESAEQVRILWKDKEAAVNYGNLLEVATAGCQELR